MGALLILFGVGAVGGLVFDHWKLPGGPMTGAMVAVVLFKSLATGPSPATPHWLKFVIYGGVGVLVGNMYQPGMLAVVRDTWPVLVGSTGLILLAGCLCAYMVARSGALSPAAAYLATSPGGFNAILGFASGASNETPIVMVYHLVRIYAIILLAPYVSRLLALTMK